MIYLGQITYHIIWIGFWANVLDSLALVFFNNVYQDISFSYFVFKKEKNHLKYFKVSFYFIFLNAFYNVTIDK
jgi:hypothetical protein